MNKDNDLPSTEDHVSSIRSRLVHSSAPEPLPSDVIHKARKKKKSRWRKVLFISFIVINVCIITLASLLYIYYQQQLPLVDHYVQQVVPQDTRIYDRNNVLLYDSYTQNQNSSGRHISVTFSEIPRVMQDAMVAIEDRTFWTNPGINVESTLRAAFRQDGGASTITQQVIKNLSHNNQHTLQRKFQEAVLAVGLTQKYSKAQILTIYFNVAAFGAFDIGIESAAEADFHLQAVCDNKSETCIPGLTRLEYNSQGKLDPVLGLARASLLAAMPNAPALLDPTLGAQAKQLALTRQKLVLQAMIAQHMRVDGQVITPALAQQAEDLMAHTDFAPYQHTKDAPHFVDWVINQIVLQLGDGDYSTGLNLFEQGGFTIRTTIDINLEKYVENAVNQHLNKPDYQYYPLPLRGDQILSKTLNIHSGAVVVLDAKTGEILAMDGSADYFSSDPAVGGQYNMAAPPPGTPNNPSGRPPGATMFPIDEMVAYENTEPLKLATVPLSVIDQSSEDAAVEQFASRFVDPAKMGTLAQNLGMMAPSDPGVPFASGAKNVSLLQMTGAYQVLADNGKHVSPVGILDIYDHEGHDIYHYNTNNPPTTQIVSTQITNLITSGLINEPARESAFGDDHQLSFADQDASCAKIVACTYQVAAQTSATNETEDGNTTIGYTPDVVVGVWVGNINGSRMNSNVVGATGAAAIWHSVIERALGWCGSQPTSSYLFRSDNIPCGTAPHLGFSTHPTRTFPSAILALDSAQVVPAQDGTR